MKRENPVYEACSQNTRDGLRDTAEIICLGFFLFGGGFFIGFGDFWGGVVFFVLGLLGFYLQVAQSIYP